MLWMDCVESTTESNCLLLNGTTFRQESKSNRANERKSPFVRDKLVNCVNMELIGEYWCIRIEAHAHR